jgi:hypothetical protein
VAVLKSTEAELGPNRVWKTHNQEQVQFMMIYNNVCGDLSKIPELVAVSSYNHLVINKFLADRGFSIALDPYAAPDFGVAAAMRFALEWFAESTLEVSGQQYSSVHLKEGGWTKTPRSCMYVIN